MAAPATGTTQGAAGAGGPAGGRGAWHRAARAVYGCRGAGRVGAAGATHVGGGGPLQSGPVPARATGRVGWGGRTMKELRVGVIGCGGQGTLHCNNARYVPGVRTVAYCDADTPRAERFLQTYGGAYATGDAQRIIGDPDLDAVFIQTGPTHHPRLVAAAARAGKHIFCEKPIALTLGEAQGVKAAVESAGVRFVYGTCNRLAPLVQRAQRIVPQPVYSLCQCQDTITHQAVHNLDLAVNLFHASPLVRVYAQGDDVWHLERDLPVDSFVATLTFADRSVHCYIQHGSSRNGTLRKYSYQLFGRAHCVFLADRFKRCIVHGSSGEVLQTLSFEGPDFTPQAEGTGDVRGPFGYMGHCEEIADLAACVRSGAEPVMTIRDAVHVLAVEKAILESAQTSLPVDFAAFCRREGIGPGRWGWGDGGV